MIEWIKKIFHFHAFKHIQYINQWYEGRCTESLEICECGKRRVKCEYWEGGTSYYYHKEAYPRYLTYERK
jgi:hypothetical protein